MEDKIKDAIMLLKNNGYVVKRWTKAMELAANECAEMDSKGKSKDCEGCPCSACLMH